MGEQTSTFPWAVVLLALTFAAQLCGGQKQLKLDFSFLSDTLNTVTLTEDKAPPFLVGFVEVSYKDKSNLGKVDCYTSSDRLSIEKATPHTWVVRLGKPLDHETEPTFEAEIGCSDQLEPPASAKEKWKFVITDVNDNAPQFLEDTLQASVTEGIPLNITILQVVAEDADSSLNGEVTYSMVPDDSTKGKPHSDYFTINSATGEITVAAEIDREEVPEFKFQIMAVDKGVEPLSCTGLVRISVQDMNDNAPRLITRELRVRENQKPNELVGTLEALDLDDGLNGEVMFLLNRDANIGFDTFDFEAMDLTTAVPQEKELPDNFPFTLTGDGKLFTASTLDREVRDQYEAEVVLMDRGRPQMNSTGFITVFVEDVNEKPVIESACLSSYMSGQKESNYEVVLEDSLANFTFADNSSMVVVDWASPDPDKLIYQVVASDPDLGENGELVYRIVPGSSNSGSNGDSLFQIDSKNGDVVLRRHFRKTDSLQQMVNVSVTDMGNPPLTVFCDISVTFDLNISHLEVVTSSTESGGGAGDASATHVTLVQTMAYVLLLVGLMGLL